MLAYILVTSQLIMWKKLVLGLGRAKEISTVRQAEDKIIQIVKPLALSFSYKGNLTSDSAEPKAHDPLINNKSVIINGSPLIDGAACVLYRE